MKILGYDFKLKRNKKIKYKHACGIRYWFGIKDLIKAAIRSGLFKCNECDRKELTKQILNKSHIKELLKQHSEKLKKIKKVN